MRPECDPFQGHTQALFLRRCGAASTNADIARFPIVFPVGFSAPFLTFFAFLERGRSGKGNHSGVEAREGVRLLAFSRLPLSERV